MPGQRVDQMVSDMTDEEYRAAEENYENYHPQADLMSFEERMEHHKYEEELYEDQAQGRDSDVRARRADYASNPPGRSNYGGSRMSRSRGERLPCVIHAKTHRNTVATQASTMVAFGNHIAISVKHSVAGAGSVLVGAPGTTATNVLIQGRQGPSASDSERDELGLPTRKKRARNGRVFGKLTTAAMIAREMGKVNIIIVARQPHASRIQIRTMRAVPPTIMAIVVAPVEEGMNMRLPLKASHWSEILTA
ncbi:hypothetical protein HO133_002920 [Letharia lupina]|uniref:Uncharacterized protein n=1 Tax=Letharia lupina TaxID=560253 RepID=A0A8H6CBJ9_9LECA|nr:uncharacterized protein HO133_002920 [Letharia lupina]KAF6220487.1 hypothetical protein HO133_002920 [Letharia lupina]